MVPAVVVVVAVVVVILRVGIPRAIYFMLYLRLRAVYVHDHHISHMAGTLHAAYHILEAVVLLVVVVVAEEVVVVVGVEVVEVVVKK